MATRRMRVYRRDGGRCRYCGMSLLRHQFTLDHLLPRARGGPDWDINLVVSCSPCNNAKGDKTVEEAGLQLVGMQGYRHVWQEIQWELAHGRLDRLTVDWRVIP